MGEITAADAERQRFEHLVLGRPRPKASRGKRRGMTPLAPAIDQQLQLRERWAHKQGTPETLERAAGLMPGETAGQAVIRRQGALERLRTSGAITGEQFDVAEAIRGIAEQIGADVAVRTASLETRVDGGDRAHGAFHEALGAVWREVAYTRWRAQLHTPGPVLEVIVADIGIAEAARRWRMRPMRLKALLIDALDAWLAAWRHAQNMIDERDLQQAHARIL